MHMCPVTKKTIINIDVVFKEQESWNGTVDTLTDAQTPLMEDFLVEEEEKQEPKEQTPNRVTWINDQWDQWRNIFCVKNELPEQKH